MNWVFFAAFIVASSAAKLDRTYLPPATAVSAGGSPESLQVPFAKSEAESLPIGSFVNEHDGVVVDVASVGTRASQSGLGGPRISYGSTASKVGDAAFRETPQGPSKFSNNVPAVLNSNLDLSAFHQPAKPSRTSFQISRDSGAHITKYYNNINNDRYSFGFEADNGIKAEEKGVISNGAQAEGGFSYVGDDGKVYSVAYTADKNGYRPVGSHLPTPPPIPKEILRALEQNSKDEAAGLSEDGSYDAQKYNTGDYTKSDANGKYNDRQTIKFSIRPESNPKTGSTFINKNQGAFIKPNIPGRIDSNTKHESSNISPQMNGITLINRNNFDKGHINLNAEIGSRNDFSEQKLQGSISSPPGSSLINKDSSNSIIPPKPLSQQDLQQQSNSGQDKPRPSSYDTSLSTVISDNISLKQNVQPSEETVTGFALKEKKYQPVGFDQSFMKPTPGVFSENFVIKNTESKQQERPTNVNIPIVSQINDQNDSQNYFTTPALNNQMALNLNNRFSTLQSSSGSFSSFGFDQTKANNDKIGGTSSILLPTTKPVLATKQPERILTTPFESFTTINNAQLPTTFGINGKQYTGSTFDNFPGLMSTSEFTSIPSTQQEIKTKTTPQIQFTSTNYNKLKVTNSPFAFSSQSSQNLNLQNQYKPTENRLQTISSFSSIRPTNFSQSTQDPNVVESTQFNEQTNGVDTSYLYNKPSKTLSTDSIRPEINSQKFSATSSNQFDSTIISQQETKFTEDNKDFITSTYNSDISGFNRQTNLPTLAPFSQTTTSENTGSYQTNGITQASISPFPSIFPTSLKFKDSGKITLKPFQQTSQINSQSQTQFFEPSKVTATGTLQSTTDHDNFNEKSKSQTQQYNNKIYEYNKPLQSFPSASVNAANKQHGHLGTQLSATTPFRGNEHVTSDQNEQTSFEMKTSSQFGVQDKNLDRKTTPFLFQLSTQQLNDKLTTSSIQNPTDASEDQNQDSGNTSQFEIYEYTKPLQRLTSSSPKAELNKNENHETQLNEQFTKQSTTGTYTETMDKFQKEAQLTTQFDQEEFERITEMPEFSQTASTFDPSIYQYTKPAQSFLTTSKQEYDNNAPLPQKETTVGVMSTNFGQQYSGVQQFGSPKTHNRFNSKQTTTSHFIQENQPSITQFINTLSTPFPSLLQQQLGNRFNSENQENIGEMYNYKKPNQTYSSSEQMPGLLDKGQNTQFNSQVHTVQSDMASLPGKLTTQIENAYNSQEKPQQNLQLNEIYEYSKPAQALTTPSKNTIIDQNINEQFGQRFDQGNSKPTTLKQNLSGDTSTTQNEPMPSTFIATQTISNFQDKFTKPDRTTATQPSFVSGINSKLIGSRPQFAFQSACCRGFQTHKHQESQFTQSTVQNTESSHSKSNQNFESQKLTTQGFISTGEDFGGPRKPPSFDEKGYHY